MTTMIYICGNAETICDGYTDERSAAWEDEIATAFVDAAADVIRRSPLDVDYLIASNFRDWHGGRHTKFNVAGKPWGYSGGGVCTHEQHVSPELEALIDEAADAGGKARDGAIADLERAASPSYEIERAN